MTLSHSREVLKLSVATRPGLSQDCEVVKLVIVTRLQPPITRNGPKCPSTILFGPRDRDGVRLSTPTRNLSLMSLHDREVVKLRVPSPASLFHHYHTSERTLNYALRAGNQLSVLPHVRKRVKLGAPTRGRDREVRNNIKLLLQEPNGREDVKLCAVTRLSSFVAFHRTEIVSILSCIRQKTGASVNQA